LELELCPSCGHWTNAYVEELGFCLECAKERGYDVCKICLRQFITSSFDRDICRECRIEQWHSQHADDLELHMSQGLGIDQARRKVYENLRPKCVVCGTGIKSGAQNGAKFCSTSERCKRARRLYTNARQRGQSPERAVEIALSKLQKEYAQ
jgi:hypothetical protein